MKSNFLNNKIMKSNFLNNKIMKFFTDLHKKFKIFRNCTIKLLFILFAIFLISALVSIISIENNIENFDLNYKNLCKSKRTHFYNLTNATGGIANKSNVTITPDGSSCAYYCDSTKCDLYTLKNENNRKICNTYNNVSNNFSVIVNCNNKKLSDVSHVDSLTYTYNGEGFVRPEFYEKNSANFVYKDYLLDKAKSIKDEYISIKEYIQNLPTNQIIQPSIYNNINTKYRDLANYLDISMENFFTSLVPKMEMYTMEENSIKLNQQDISYINLLKTFKKLETNNINNDGLKENDDLILKREYLLYIIILFICFISIIVLILYKVASIITNGVLITYFIGIFFLMLFIHFYLQ
jgi:hypothetical protein